MNELELTAIKQRVEAATPGPWPLVKKGNSVPSLAIEGICGVMSYSRPANAEFIAHAREDVPALLAEVERLQTRNRTLNHALKQVDELIHDGATVAELRRCCDVIVDAVSVRPEDV